VQLHRDRERFRAAGVELVVIGQGRPDQADHFRRSQGVEELELLPPALLSLPPQAATPAAAR